MVLVGGFESSTLYYPLYLEVRLPRYLRGDDAVQWRVSRHLIMFPAVSHLIGLRRARHRATRLPTPRPGANPLTSPLGPLCRWLPSRPCLYTP